MKNSLALDFSALPLIRARSGDAAQLARPRIGSMVLFTVLVGFSLASRAQPDLGLFTHTVVGTALLVVGASVLNQVFERDTDLLMARTASRPIPSGRLSSLEALIFGSTLAVGGVLYLVLMVRQPRAILTAGLAFAIYVFLYTPLKQKVIFNTLVGAAAGALPPVIGWTAATNSFDAPAIVLFAIVFLWQIPHFLAIAWIYRDEYARARLRMLPVIDADGSRTARHMIGYCMALLAVSAIPALAGWAGHAYLTSAGCLGLGLLMATLGFWKARSVAAARRVLRMSLVYLPTLLAFLLIDKIS
jgi:protoheme IX farnesyltransferase